MSTPPQERTFPSTILVDKRRIRPTTLANTFLQEIPHEPADEELMARLRAHNPEALEVLFDRYSRLVLSIALRILKDQGEAEDAVQDIFLYLYKRAMLFDPSKGPAKAWIARVAFHRALDRKSYLGRRGFYLDVHFDSLEDTLLGATDLEREIGSKLNHAALEQAFTELPDAQRRTLAMFYFEGLDLREIAGKLNEPLGNVRHFYYRGLQRLRKSAYIGKLQKD